MSDARKQLILRHRFLLEFLDHEFSVFESAVQLVLELLLSPILSLQLPRSFDAWLCELQDDLSDSGFKLEPVKLLVGAHCLLSILRGNSLLLAALTPSSRILSRPLGRRR